MVRYGRVVLFAFFVVIAAHRASEARVLPVVSSSFLVSVQVAAACEVDTVRGGSASAAPVVRCNGVAPTAITDVAASALSHPTGAEQGAAAEAQAISVVY